MELFCQVIIGSSVIYMEPIIGKVAKTGTLSRKINSQEKLTGGDKPKKEHLDT